MKVSIKFKKSVLTLFIVFLGAYLFCQSANNTRVSVLKDNLEALSGNDENNNGIVPHRCYSSIEVSNDPEENYLIYMCKSGTTMHLIPQSFEEGDILYPCINKTGNKDFGAKTGYCFIPNNNN